MKETMKLSAAMAGSYYLSANQIALPISMMVKHRKIHDGLWYDPDSLNLNNEITD